MRQPSFLIYNLWRNQMTMKQETTNAILEKLWEKRHFIGIDNWDAMTATINSLVSEDDMPANCKGCGYPTMAENGVCSQCPTRE